MQAAALPRSALAQACPSKVTTVIVPFAAGGTTDILAHILAQALPKELEPPGVADNRAGAGGNIGAALAAKALALALALADGYTLFMGAVGTHAINASPCKKMPFDPVKDFAPLTRVANVPNLLSANPEQPHKSVQEMIAYAKANPGVVYVGSAGNGSSVRLSGELFKSRAKVNMVQVPCSKPVYPVTRQRRGSACLRRPPRLRRSSPAERGVGEGAGSARCEEENR